MTTSDDKNASNDEDSSRKIPLVKETEILTKREALTQPHSGQQVRIRAEEQMLLPHERDETTGAAATGQANETGLGRAVIGQAAEDIERGLEDTDCWGIPSDIFGLGHCAPASASGNEAPKGSDALSDRDKKSNRTP